MADFDPGAGTSNLTSFGSEDIFVSKLDSAGNFVYGRQLGGTLTDRGFGIAVDGSGNVYTTGFFQGTVDFDPGAGTSNLTSAGDVDIFVSKLTCDSPAQQLTNLCAIVNQLRDDGVLNQGNANSLCVKLDNAKKSLANGNTSAGVNQIQAFINEVDAFRKAKKLTNAQADSLIASANAIIVSVL